MTREPTHSKCTLFRKL